MPNNLTWAQPTAGNPTIWAPATEVYITVEGSMTFICTEADVPLSTEDANV